MKCNFSYAIKYLSGTFDDITYAAHTKSGYTIARKWVIPRLTIQTVTIGASMVSIAAIWKEVSPDFLKNIKQYSTLYSRHRKDPSPWAKKDTCGYTIFVKLIWGLKRHLSGNLDIPSLTISDIRSSYRIIESISSSCQNRILPKVPGWENLTKRI